MEKTQHCPNCQETTPQVSKGSDFIVGVRYTTWLCKDCDETYTKSNYN